MSEIVVIAPPQDRAVTLEEARQQLRLDARDEDLLLGAKLDASVLLVVKLLAALVEGLVGDAARPVHHRHLVR